MRIELSTDECSLFKAAAHSLKPVVMIGGEGLSPAVLREIDVSLRAHELIKIRVFSDDHDEREVWLDSICEELNASPVQHIGKILVVYRENPDKSEPAPARPARAAPRLTKRQEAERALRGGSGPPAPFGAKRARKLST